MADSKRRRRRPAISCTLCRQRKIRCNREQPCSNCVKSRGGTCTYETESSTLTDQPSATTPAISQSSGEAGAVSLESSVSKDSAIPTENPVSTTTTFLTLGGLEEETSALDLRSVKNRLDRGGFQRPTIPKKCEHPSTGDRSSTIETTISRLGGAFHIHRDSRRPGEPQSISRSVSHKTRLFGQSHWFNTIYLVLDVIEILEPHLRNESSAAHWSIMRCKTLSKAIKLQRAPSWPTSPTNDLPPKNVTDELVDCYIRTIESVHRVLHIPSFRKDYEALWLTDKEPDTAFMVQLKLVLAIGATNYDALFSLRASAIRWVYEAQTWLASPRMKSKLGIQTLQTNVLLLVAQEMVDVDPDAIWIAAGTLFRRAVHVGLHRDPACLPKRPSFGAEMHRRLWNTVLELAVQSSLTSGGPPLISLNDFDTQPPGNFDDEQLLTEGAIPKPDTEFTQTSIAIALRRLLPARLTVVKFLNEVRSSGTYDETLRLDAGLRAAYKTVRQTMSKYTSSAGPSPSQYETRLVDFYIQRYLSSLHIPFFGPALKETAYAFSRKVVVDTSLKTWHNLFPSSSITSTQSRDSTVSNGHDDLERIVTNGSGLHRKAAMQSGMLLSVELKTQLQEDDSVNPVLLRPDLLTVIEEARAWTLRCISAGETSMKGYLFMSILIAQIHGLLRGVGKEEMSQLLIQAAEDAPKVCEPIFEGLAGTGPVDLGMDDVQQMPTASSFGIMDDWEFMMADAFASTNNMDPMSWMYNGQGMQGSSAW